MACHTGKADALGEGGRRQGRASEPVAVALHSLDEIAVGDSIIERVIRSR